MVCEDNPVMSSADLIMPASDYEAYGVDESECDDSGARVGVKSNKKKIKVKNVKKPSRALPTLPMACPEKIKIRALPMACCVWYCEEKAGIHSKYCKKHLGFLRALQQKAAHTGNLEIQAKLVGDFEKASRAVKKFWRGTVHH